MFIPRHFSLVLCLILTGLTGLPTTAAADHWPHWRGPHFDGTSAETNLPSTWSEDAEGKSSNILWRLDMPGSAASTPIVWDDHIFVTSTKEGSDALLVLAVNRKGEVRWTHEADQGSFEIFEQFAHETSPASPSPVTDGKHVWVLFGTGKLLKLDFDGKLAWQTDLAERYGKPNMYFGLSASPLLLDGRLYFQFLHTDAQLVLALDAETGKEIWKQTRETDAVGECLHSYASVMPFSPTEGDDLLLVHGADYTTAHSLKDGTEVWRYGTLNAPEEYNKMFRLVATPVSADGLIIVPTAKRGPVFGLRPGIAKGKLGEAQVAWKLDRGTPDVPSPIVHDGIVYLAGERGTMTALDAKTGEKIYDERVHQSPHRGSPVFADGKIYLTGSDGTVSVLKPGREFEILSKNEISGGRLAATPAVSGGMIFLRSYEALYAIGVAE